MVSIVSDLLTSTRIAATAKQLGVGHVAAPPDRAVEACRRSSADLVLVDLECAGDPIEAIRAIKQDPATASTPVVAFYPHVRNALRESALGARADRVLPRSAFARQLAELIAGEPAPPE